jgi:IPT/TIG domain
VITFREVQESPTGWEDETMSFESELTDLIDSYRNKVNKHYVSRALTGAADVVEKDEGWIYDETNLEPEEEEAPTLSSISPDTAELNSADVTMICTGSGFTEDSVINFAGNDEPIVFVSDTEISTVVKPSLPWGAVSVPVLVKNGTAESASLNFTFTEAAGE